MHSIVTFEMLEQASAYVRDQLNDLPRVGIVLGSGLSRMTAQIVDPVVIPYGDIPHFVPSTAPGHSGQLVGGLWNGQPVLIMQGRLHFYEGYSTAQITMPIRVMQRLGTKTLIVTNASGGIRPGFRPGDVMAITDHINLVGLAGNHPLRGPNDDRLGTRFPSMRPAYDLDLLELIRNEARSQGLSLWEGVYVMVAGPSYETPAEVRFLRAIGADAVGMSTAPEVVVAVHGGMRVLGLSLITNIANDSLAGADATDRLHEEVLSVGEKAVPAMTQLIAGFLGRL